MKIVFGHMFPYTFPPYFLFLAFSLRFSKKPNITKMPEKKKGFKADSEFLLLYLYLSDRKQKDDMLMSEKLLEVLKQNCFKVPHRLWKCLYNTL